MAVPMRTYRLTLWRVFVAVASILYVSLWVIWHLSLRDKVAPESTVSSIDTAGLAGMYALGLLWLVWGIERAGQYIEAKRTKDRSAADLLTGRVHSNDARSLNPLDPGAWYYGRHSQRFRQSIALVSLYFLGCYGLFLILHPSAAQGSSNEKEPYELPDGGGSDQMAGAQPVQVQKIVKKQKKLLVNPFRRSI